MPQHGALAIGNATIVEGDDGVAQMQFTVTRTGGTDGAVSASYTITFNGSADASDLATPTLAGTVNFAAGSDTATILVPVAGDRTFEPNETFSVTLSAPSGGATIAGATAIGTITNDDFPPAANVFINEINYDPDGADTGEFLELAGLAGTNLAGWSVVLYNGNGGGSYATIALSGVLSDTANGFGIVALARPNDGIQNGSPDGVALVDNFGRVVQFLSYEGTMTATNGPAAGQTSVDIGVEQGNATTGTSLQLAGSGSSYDDFHWTAGDASTAGGTNSDQSFRSGTDAGELRIDDARVVEGTGGTSVLTFTVHRAGGFASAASVEYAIDFNAAADAADLLAGTPLAGTVSFAAGEYSRTISVPVATDSTGERNESFAINLGATSGNVVVVDGVAVGTILNDDRIPLSIMEIQGAGHVSDYVGQPVSTTGIVTAVDTNGYYLQDAVGDDDLRTSNAVFVFTGAAPAVAVGDALALTGIVGEFKAGVGLSVTQIGSATATIVSRGNALPEAVLIGVGGVRPPTETIDDDALTSFDIATDGIDFWESLEGMLVTVDAPLVVSNSTTFGETDIVASHGVGATGVNARGGITISDGDYNPEKLQLDQLIDPPFGAGQVHSIGDQLASVTGVINYSFEQYELLAFAPVTVTSDVTLSDNDTVLHWRRQPSVDRHLQSREHRSRRRPGQI